MILLAWVAGILLILAFGKALKVPVKIAVKLLINGLLGGAVILLINLLGQYLNFQISERIIRANRWNTRLARNYSAAIVLKYLL